MKPWVWWALWMLCYAIGSCLLSWMDAPNWGAALGGWVFALGVMGQCRETW